MPRAIVMAAIGLAGCKGADAKARQEADKACKEARGDDTAEALEWLERDDTMGFAQDKETMRSLAREFYDAGATRVDVGYSAIEETGVEIGGYFIVDLPGGKEMRGAVIAVQHRVAEELELTPARDVGQACLVVGLD